MPKAEAIKYDQKHCAAAPIPKRQTPYEEMEDSVVWERFKEGDESAFVFIYDQFFEELCHFGLQYAQLPVVEDCVQDMFVDLRRKKERLPEIKCSVRLFLFQSLKRRIYNVQKKRKHIYKDQLSDHLFEIILPQESLLILNQNQKEQLEKLDKALAGLNEKQREVVYYYFYKGMSYEEVQELMGYGHVKSARNMVYRIVNTLKKIFSLGWVLIAWIY